MIINSLLRHCDIFSIKPELKVNGNSRYHTNFSIITGLISIIIILVFSIIFINDVFSKKKINMIYNLDNRKYSNISLSGKHVGLLITDLYGKEIPEFERIFSIKALHWKVVFENLAGKTNQDNINSGLSDSADQIFKAPNLTIKNVIVGDCKQNVTKNSIYYRIGSYYKSVVCIDLGLNQISLEGKFYGSLEGYSTLNIYLNKCINSTENGNKCLPQAHIDKVLEQAILSFFTSEFDVNPDDTENPLQEYNSLNQVQISATIFKRFEKKYNKIIFNNDKGLIYSDIETHEAFRSENIVESVDLRASSNVIPGAFNQLMLQGSGKNEVFSRSYMKFSTALANISGILQLIMFAGQFLIYFWSRNSMLEFVVTQFFSDREKNNFLKCSDEFNDKYVVNNNKRINLFGQKETNNDNLVMPVKFNNNKNKSNFNNANFNFHCVNENNLSNNELGLLDNSKNLFCNKENSNFIPKLTIKNKFSLECPEKRKIGNLKLFEAYKAKSEITIRASGSVSRPEKNENFDDCHVKIINNLGSNMKTNNLNNNIKETNVILNNNNELKKINDEETNYNLNLQNEQMKKQENVIGDLRMQGKKVRKNLTKMEERGVLSNSCNKHFEKKFLGIWDKFCFNSFFLSKEKRKLFEFANELIVKRLSIEYFLNAIYFVDKIKNQHFRPESKDLLGSFLNL